MKPYKILSVLVAMLMVLSGCEESKSKSELDEILDKVPTANLVNGKVEYTTVFDENTQFSSVTGKVTSVSVYDITIEANGQEYIFALSNDVKIYNGKIGIADDVTITYEGTEYKEGAVVITILLLSEDSEVALTTVSVEEPPEEKEEIIAEPEPIPVETTEEITTTITTTVDNSAAIAEAQEMIDYCMEKIDIYKWGIGEYQTYISDTEDLRARYEKELHKANINLENAKKKEIYVFGDNGFERVPDQGAIDEAQEVVDYYEDLIATCDANIAEANLEIEKCNVEISALESEIAVYQAMIEELS